MQSIIIDKITVDIKYWCFFLGAVYDATFPNVMRSLTRYLHMKIITIHCIAFCAPNVQRICPALICLICTYLRNMIHFLPYKLNANQW